MGGGRHQKGSRCAMSWRRHGNRSSIRPPGLGQRQRAGWPGFLRAASACLLASWTASTLGAEPAGPAAACSAAVRTASESHDYAPLSLAFPSCLEAARHGDPISQFNVAAAYERGREGGNGGGPDKDLRQAFEWYRRSAEQGNCRAAGKLGNFLADGLGVPRDLALARTWYLKAAEGGNEVAAHNLGAMYANGEGVPRDMHEAIRWYRRAAAAGYRSAQSALGWRLLAGQGLPRDLQEGARLTMLAAAQGDAQAQHNLAGMHAEGIGVSRDMVEAMKWALLALRGAKGEAMQRHFDGTRALIAERMSRAELDRATEEARSFRPQRNSPAPCVPSRPPAAPP